MNRSQERWGRGGGNRGYSSDGDIGTREGEPLFKEGETAELLPVPQVEPLFLLLL